MNDGAPPPCPSLGFAPLGNPRGLRRDKLPIRGGGELYSEDRSYDPRLDHTDVHATSYVTQRGLDESSPYKKWQSPSM